MEKTHVLNKQDANAVATEIVRTTHLEYGIQGRSVQSNVLWAAMKEKEEGIRGRPISDEILERTRKNLSVNVDRKRDEPFGGVSINPSTLKRKTDPMKPYFKPQANRIGPNAQQQAAAAVASFFLGTDFNN